MATTLDKKLFGKTSKGEDIYKFTFTNVNNVSISILTFGCVVYEIDLPDKDGNVTDVNLGFDNVKDYEVNNNNFGVLCGRVANRIGGGEMTIDGVQYKLSRNDPLGDTSVMAASSDSAGFDNLSIVLGNLGLIKCRPR